MDTLESEGPRLSRPQQDRSRPRAGRPLDERLKAEADIRRRIVAGKLRPGDRIETREAIARRLGCSVLTVQRACAALEREGTLARGARRRDGTVVAEAPDCLMRFLIVAEANRTGPLALARATEAAAHRLSEERGLRFDFVLRWRQAPDSDDLSKALEMAREGRYAGVFIPTPFHQYGYHDPALDISGVPTGVIDHFRRDAQASRLALMAGVDSGKTFWARAAQDILDCGARRPAVIAPLGSADADPETGIRREFRRAGLEIPAHFFHTSNQFWNNDAQLRRIVAWLFDGPQGQRADALVLGNDNFVPAAEEALVATLGVVAARGVALVARGNKPALPSVRLPFRWHGCDIGATLADFVDWCSAVRAGRRYSAPRMVTF